MNIISLNTWGGRAGRQGLLDFFARHKDIDVFCLQEMWSGPYEYELEKELIGGEDMNQDDIMVRGVHEVSGLLKDTHVPFFRPHHLDNYGLMMLVKKSIEIIEEGDEFVYMYRGYRPEGDLGFHARNVQYVTIQTDRGPRTVMNFHGLWNGKGKGDSEDRLKQSEHIIQLIKNMNTKVVLCGDFNLLPHTQSIKMLEDTGLRNLIKEYGITSTRTSHYTKPEKFADYAFVSDGIEVMDFKVLPDEVSDHAPLYIECM